jgi:hypothetical protein
MRTEFAHPTRRLVIQNNPESTVDRVLEISGVRAQLLCSDTLDEAVEFAAQCYREELATTD